MTVAILLAPATRVGYLLYPVDFFVWAWLLRSEDTVDPPPDVRGGVRTAGPRRGAEHDDRRRRPSTDASGDHDGPPGHAGAGPRWHAGGTGATGTGRAPASTGRRISPDPTPSTAVA